MTRALLTTVVLAALVPATALGGGRRVTTALGGAAGGGEGVTVPYYDHDGNLICRIAARKVTPNPNDPKTLQATAVHITFYYEGKKHTASAASGLFDAETKRASLKGNVVLTLDHERPIRVRAGQLHYFGLLGLASTEAPDAKARKALADGQNPAEVLRALVCQSKTRVTVSTTGITTEGFGLLVALSQVKAAKGKNAKRPPLTDHLIMGRQIETTVASIETAGLLAGARAPKAKPDRTTPPPTAPRPGNRPPPPTTATPPAPDKKPDAPKEPAKPPPSPVVITCPGPLAVHREDLTAVYHGNDQRGVRLAQGERSLTCDTLTVRFHAERDPETKELKPGLDSVTAHGDVVIDSGGDIATAAIVAWHARDGLAVLTGSPATITWDDGSKLAAGRIRRKTRIVETRDPETGRVEKQEVLDWVECAATPECPHSVYLLARTLAELRRAPSETRHAPPQAPQDR